MSEELTKEEKKALRKEKLEKIFNVAKIALPFIGAGIISCMVAYEHGKEVGHKKALSKDNPELLFINAMHEYEAAEEYEKTLLDTVLNADHYGSKITYADGTTKFIDYKVTDEAPEWWSDCQPFSMLEATMENIEKADKNGD